MNYLVLFSDPVLVSRHHNLNSFDYPGPIVDHKWARDRALEAYKIGLAKL